MHCIFGLACMGVYRANNLSPGRIIRRVKDPIVEEVREIRDRIAACFDYDVKAIGRYYQQKQRENKRKKIAAPLAKYG